MSLSPGTRLGPYEILAAIGAGGMGEVYRARDTRLDRPVAIKVLPASLAADPKFRDRFEREARNISLLSHPNVCALYDVGRQDGIEFLVMEFLDGETLAARIEKGPLPIADALRIGIEIAAALDAAHRLGITHRDLKPGNVMLSGGRSSRSAGPAKLLDFGLAKAASVAVAATGGASLATAAAPLTGQGTILGTFQYMAPEQIEGQEADARSDIWAFGCVLYEMLTGGRAFSGRTHASLVSAILKDPAPRVSAVQPVAPASLDHVIGTCLAKDPAERWQATADITRELRWIADTLSTPSAAAVEVRRRWRFPERVAWLGAVVVLAGAAAAGWMRSTPEVRDGPVVRAALPFASADALVTNAYPTIALSPDGRYLAYRGGVPGQLHIRTMDDAQSRVLAGTEGALYPFFSPDGQSIGFLLGRVIKRMALGGGAPVTVVDLTTANLRGVCWGDDGYIYYTPTVSAGLWRIKADAGGAPEELTRPDFASGEKTHRFPFVLPGSKLVLYMVGTSRITSFDEARIDALSLDTRKTVHLIEGGIYPQYVGTGHLLYTRDGRLIAVPFDAKGIRLTGPPVIVADRQFLDPYYGAGNMGVSRDGVFARIAGMASYVPQKLVKVDRRGTIEEVPMAPMAFAAAGRVSPAGSHFATYLLGATSQLTSFDLSRGTTTRLTYEWDNESPVWSADGTRLAFVSNRGGGTRTVHWMRADGGGEPTRLTTSAHEQGVSAWSPDGKTIVYVDTDPSSGADIWAVSVDGKQTVPIVKTPADDLAAALSPDGKWLAYQTNQSGRFEVYVQAFPNAQRRWQISADGGTQPIWQRNGRELVFRKGRSVLAAAITTAPEFHAAEPAKLFDTSNPLLDTLPDGRLLMRTSTPPPPVTELEIVVNWFSELRRRTGGG